MKKAQESTLAVLIILLAIAIILISAWGIYAKVLRMKTDIEACRLSVLGKSHVKPGGKSPLELKCSRSYITFYDNKVISEMNGKETKKKVSIKGVQKENFDALTDKILFYVMAEELKNCWYKMGEGDYLPFDQQVMKKNSVCLMCSVINFDNELQQNPLTFTGFAEYLNNTFMPGTVTIPGSGVTYADYLTRGIYERQRVPIGDSNFFTVPFLFTRVEIGQQSALEVSDTFSTSNTYYIIYQSFNPTLIKWNFVDEFSILFGGTPRDEVYGALFIIPADDISLLSCDMLYN